MSLRVLYVGQGHPLQEADDLLTLDKLGYDWFSTGYYRDNCKPGDLPFIQVKNNEKRLELFNKCQRGGWVTDTPDTPCGQKNKLWTGQDTQNIFKFTKEFADEFDVIICNFFPHNIMNNKDAFDGKLVILKTFAMHPIQWEQGIRECREAGVLSVRNSPLEPFKYGADYAGHDAIIRGSVVKDEHELSGWTGKELCSTTFTSFFDYPSTENIVRAKRYEYVKAKLKYPNHIFGVLNQQYFGKDTFISHEEKIKRILESRVSLCIGTPGSSSTYSFVEAWVAGQPIVAFGENQWQSPNYELKTLIDNDVNGFYSDNLDEVAEYTNMLCENKKKAKELSIASRAKAVSIFGRETISRQWDEFIRENV